MSAIMIAAKTGNHRVAKLLITRGADLNARNAKEQTALDIAKAQNRVRVVALLEQATGATGQSGSLNSGGRVAGAFSGKYFALIGGVKDELWDFNPDGTYLHRQVVQGGFGRTERGTYRLEGGYVVLNSNEKVSAFATSGYGGAEEASTDNSKNTRRLKIRLIGPHGKNGMVLDGVTYEIRHGW